MEKLNCANFPRGWTSRASKGLKRAEFYDSGDEIISASRKNILKIIYKKKNYDCNEIVNHFKFFHDEPQKVIARDGEVCAFY